MSKTAIIGGGIAGLATAFYLQEAGFSDFTLIECASRCGGKITSADLDGFLVEGGPDSFITQKAAAIDLCTRLGLASEFVGANTGKNAATYVWSEGRLHPMPEGMMLMAPTMILPMLRSRLLSWPGKLRLGLEPFIPKAADEEDESLGSFVRRRLGSEMLNKIAGPLMGGIHAADPDKLSLRSTFPIFSEMEKKHGSLTRAMMKRKRAKPHAAPSSKPIPMFMSLRGGLQRLSDALVNRLPQSSLRTCCCVLSVTFHEDQYKLHLSDGSSILVDNLVFATPSYVTADLVQQIDPALACRLRAIRYVSTATVSLGYRRSDIAHPMRGAGFIVPRSEGRSITACSWSSAKFNHRAPEDCVLLRVFIGGAQAEDLAEQDESTLIEVARHELLTIMGISATPVLARAYRWPKANPQYELGHAERITELEHALTAFPGLYVAGAAYRGSGIPDCIQSGMKAAKSIVDRAHATALYHDNHDPVAIGS
ncbi:MAG TPA: protoporphyrinogen oxidase [Acidobacteriaceae bacterium]|jgi:oxygen-dependent protoporphyrinogen oxidase